MTNLVAIAAIFENSPNIEKLSVNGWFPVESLEQLAKLIAKKELEHPLAELRISEPILKIYDYEKFRALFDILNTLKKPPSVEILSGGEDRVFTTPKKEFPRLQIRLYNYSEQLGR